MKISLDTNRYSDMARGQVDALDIVANASEVYVPFVVIGELRAGFKQGSREAANEEKLQVFLARPGVVILYADEETTREYASIEARLRKQGRAIPSNDVWIAAITIQHGLTLYSRDPHFDNLPEIPRV
ncbi:MAG TPA: type II toxin-antitoxin system VapC family toxin [Phycisphaerae bacterium]|jgi:predicted nucleic acid-binding protein